MLFRSKRLTKDDCDAMPSLYSISRERIRRERIRRNGGRDLTLDDLLGYCNDENVAIDGNFHR